jgi:hypothetical protein
MWLEQMLLLTPLIAPGDRRNASSSTDDGFFPDRTDLVAAARARFFSPRLFRDRPSIPGGSPTIRHLARYRDTSNSPSLPFRPGNFLWNEQPYKFAMAIRLPLSHRRQHCTPTMRYSLFRLVPATSNGASSPFVPVGWKSGSKKRDVTRLSALPPQSFDC